MIPVLTMNSQGEMSYQVFNDALAPVEQINRKLVAAIYYAQLNLTNSRDEFSRLQNKGELTAEQIATINSAATTLVESIKSAITTFEGALENTSSQE